MKKLLEKEIYEAPIVMEISPVSFVAGQGESGTPDEMGPGGVSGGDDDLDPA